MEPKLCKCCGAPLKNDVCDYCGVSYVKTYTSEKIVESDFLNGNMKPFYERPILKAKKRL
jgi:hypothetical protein